IVGGLIGETYWQWLYVDVLWVHELFRGKGYGDILLATAEQEAVKRGCQYAYLDTFSFQAPEFYRKRGYVVFGELPNFPQGYSRFFSEEGVTVNY
ncbi:GNAT family N-acetyltransferase, partial [Fischerella thermalis]